MPVIDFAAILAKGRKDTERIRALGIAEEEEHRYYNSLPMECGDPPQEQEAFQNLISSRDLSEDDKVFVRAYLDERDPR